MASRLNPSALLLEPAIPQEQKDNAAACVFAPDNVLRIRSDMLSFPDGLSTALTPLRSRWVAALPPDSPARNLNFPVMYFLPSHFAYDDKQFVKELAAGMPISGSIPASGVLRPRPTPAIVSLEQWRAPLVPRIRMILGRVLSTHNSLMATACWEHSLRELEKGRITTPTLVTPAVSNTIAITPRYAKEEPHGGRATKISLIGDFRAAGINDAMSLEDTSIPESLGCFLAAIAHFRKLSPDLATESFSLDFSHAYKHVPIIASQREFATIVMVGPDGNAYSPALRSQPFGSRRAPSNWVRVTQFPKWALSRFFKIAIAVYVDDIHGAEPLSTAKSAFLNIKAVCALFGCSLDASKESPPPGRLTFSVLTSKFIKILPTHPSLPIALSP